MRKCLEIILFIFCLALPSVLYAKTCSVTTTKTCFLNSDCPVGESCIATMTDYCASPPFIASAIKPNLLLMIDNSASMFDLEYVDLGKKVCSATQTTVCTTNGDCPAGETCSVTRRNATYCYDESYSSRNTYFGYFDSAQFYQYDMTNEYFYSVPTFPADAGTCAGVHTAKFRANTLCAEIDETTSPKTLVKFIASGRYLNWLGASKFDVEKGILTGGKYGNLTATTKGLMPESRGCVGRKFIKEAITADFQNYDGCTPPTVCDPNTSLEITFGVRGPVDTNNPTNVSKGGQTYIDVYEGNYDAANCQAAIDLFATGGKEEIVKAVDLCLSNAATNKKTCSLDFSADPAACNSDLDCASIPGICNITRGSCNSVGGVCGVSTSGTCTANSGSCTGAGKCVGGNRPGIGCTRNQDCTGNGTCMATCAGGRWAGSTCVNDASCAYNSCTSGKPAGTSCNINSDCDIKNCTNAGANLGKSCTTDAQCNVGTCTAPASKVGVFCSVSSDCNTGTCPATAPANANGPCTTDAQCSTASKGFCMAPVTTQIKSTFTQSMNSCYQFMRKDIPIGINEIQQVSNPNGCNQIYKENKICNGGTSDGNPCDTIGPDPKCPGGTCINGPESIRTGSPVLLCNTKYAGYCAANTNADNWATTTWLAREYASPDDCIKAKYAEYCGAVEIPPVVDPTDDPSNTTNYNNLPAIISDVSVVAQLRDPIRSLTARVKRDDAPSGLIQDFSSTDAIRFGAMSFDFNGSRTECGTRDPVSKTATGIAYCTNNITRACTADTDCGGTGQCVPAVPCPYVCNNAPQIACTILPDGSNRDCDAGVSCVLSTSFFLSNPNLDGSHVLTNSYIGPKPPLFPDWGHGAAGLINDIDNLTANAWTPFSEGLYNAIGYYALTAATVTPAMRLDSGDFNTTPVPSQWKCQKNNVLLITDGQSTADLNKTVTNLVSTNSGLLPAGASFDTAANNSCIPYAGSRNIEDLAWFAQNRNIQDMTKTPASSSQKIATYVVYSGTGSLDSASCPSADLTTLNWDCQPDNLMCKTARYGGGKYYLAQDPASLATSLRNAFTEISTNAASGTAASVLASGEGSGANLVQAIFYPDREMGADKVKWTGRLQNFWYFIDPRLGSSTIMEDTDMDGALKLSKDSTVNFVYDSVSHQTTVSTTSPGGLLTTGVSLDNVHYLWEAGNLLLGKSPSSRTIYTPCSINNSQCLAANPGLMNFSTTNLDGATQRPYLQAASSAEADNIVNYTRGTDISGYRPRTLPMCSVTPRACSTSSDCPSGESCNLTGVWKLGDIINSTPKILSWVPANTYYELYQDTSYYNFTSTSDYKSRGVVFAGANDGMLHAIKLGLLGLYPNADLKATLGTHCSVTKSQSCECPNDPPTYPCSSGMTPACPGSETCVKDLDLGQEMWALIPKNTLPFLKYLADPTYCHIYSIDAQPFIFDASFSIAASSNTGPPDPNPDNACDPTHYWNCRKATRCIDPATNSPDKDCTTTVNKFDPDNTSWRTVLIGSMRLGGACRNSADTNPCRDCTTTPIDNVGYSSYFAVDITDPTTPKLLWEFSDPALGFSTSGPAIVKVVNQNLVNKREKNGRWLAVFGSGPTGWISQNNNWVIAPLYDKSVNYFNHIHNMKLFVVDLATGALVTTIDTGEQGAFAGSLVNGTMDYDQGDLSRDGNYQDDAVYFGYTQLNGDTITPLSGSQGCAPQVAGNTLVLQGSPSDVDDYYKGYFVDMWKYDNLTGWNYEGFRLITNYAGATKTATLDSPWPVSPDPMVLTCSPTGMFYRISKPWNRGGVKRLLTNQDIDPTHWAVSSVIDSNSLSGNAAHNSRMGAGMGAVTAAVKKLQNYTYNTLSLFFGTGRYYYRMAPVGNSVGLLDDPSDLRALYGIKEPCLRLDATVDPVCTTRTSGNIAGGAPKVSNIAEVDPTVTDATGAAIGMTDTTKAGWWITLDGCRDSSFSTVACLTNTDVDNSAAFFKPERVVTDPLAATNGGVFFSTIIPTSDPCEYGGRSYLWGVRYDTGGSLVPTGILKGKAIIQRSTGDIEQIDLATAFTEKGKMKTTASFGLTGSGGISIVVPPPPINRILHIQKR